MPRKSCTCGGVCKGNAKRCATNARLQALAKQKADQRRAELHVVEEPGEDIAEVLMRVCEARS